MTPLSRRALLRVAVDRLDDAQRVADLSAQAVLDDRHGAAELLALQAQVAVSIAGGYAACALALSGGAKA